MQIRISGAKMAPTWTNLQEVVREATKSESGRFVRINREDGGVDYRGLGRYEVDFRTDDNDILELELIVE